MAKREKPLSRLQKEALEKLSRTSWASSYTLSSSLATLRALKVRGLAKSLHQQGSSFFPHNQILWRITEKGKLALMKALGQ